MPRTKRNLAQSSFLENYGRTAPAVPAIKEGVARWRESGYKGATPTTLALLNYWFLTDHRLPTGGRFKYHFAQREAIESVIYTFEIAKTRSLTALYQTFIPAELARDVRLAENDPFARYCVKMATGSGKTKVMSLAVACQYFNAVIENDPDYARTFLIIAPNVIVFERLSTDFVGGRIFKQDPVIPKEFTIYWDMQTYIRGESERATSLGGLYLTNIQQLYEGKPSEDEEETEIMTLMLGSKPPASLDEGRDFRTRILNRGDGRVMVINDEAHHTHDENSTWNETIRGLHDSHALGLSAQLDFSATPRYTSGALFAWTVSDYTLKQAIVDRIVKRPVKGITSISEVPSDVASLRYEPFLVAAVERWREYREQLKDMGKKPLLFVMMNNTDEADSIGDYLRSKYPTEFGGDKTLIIHTNRSGEIVKDDLDKARKAAREVDLDSSPVNVIVSVLMLREGWDVQNVTVIVGLRPYTAKANILPEQTIGRGLRLMFRNIDSPYIERVDIIGNKGFIEFVERLEQQEELELDTWQVGKEKLVITVIQPESSRASYDIALPVLSPILARASNIADEVDSLNVMAFKCPPLPLRHDSNEAKTFKYEGRDILTLETLVEREYTIPQPQTAGEVISYFAQIIAAELKLPSQFSVLAPKIQEFLKFKAFGREVDLEAADVLQAISTRLTLVVTREEFLKALQHKINQPQTPVLENTGRLLSGLDPFPWSQETAACQKTILNNVPCDNQFEREFALFLDKASDVARFSKLPMNFGFTIPYSDKIGNLRHYYPDFVVVDRQDVHYIVETKGREDTDVINKDRAAVIWTENATALCGQEWCYVKVMQGDYRAIQPSEFVEVAYKGTMQLSMFD
jgi:type III restriction enzyme